MVGRSSGNKHVYKNAPNEKLSDYSKHTNKPQTRNNLGGAQARVKTKRQQQ